MPTKKSTTRKAKSAGKQLVPADSIDHRILLIRGQRVMLDSDLAALYGVATRVLNQAVKRNLHRFPEDFMLEEANEVQRSRSQIVTLKRGQNVKYASHVFTKPSAVLLTSILNSPIAVVYDSIRSYLKNSSLMLKL